MPGDQAQREAEARDFAELRRLMVRLRVKLRQARQADDVARAARLRFDKLNAEAESLPHSLAEFAQNTIWSIAEAEVTAVELELLELAQEEADR